MTYILGEKAIDWSAIQEPVLTILRTVSEEPDQYVGVDTHRIAINLRRFKLSEEATKVLLDDQVREGYLRELNLSPFLREEPRIRIRTIEDLTEAQIRAEQAQKNFLKSPKGIAIRRKYQHSDKGKLVRKTYWSSEKGKAAQKRWREKSKAAQKRWRENRTQLQVTLFEEGKKKALTMKTPKTFNQIVEWLSLEPHRVEAILGSLIDAGKITLENDLYIRN